jgi:hypothetical protein
MLAGGFGGGRPGKQLLVGDSAPEAADAVEAGGASGEGAGLVERRACKLFCVRGF